MNVSVIIPVHNADLFIEKAVQSALEQKEVSEILLIEDGSSDDSLKVCQRLEKEHVLVKLFQHPNSENRGAGASRNLGIENASGDLIAFLDADDFYLPNRFEKHVSLLSSEQNIDATFSAVKAEFQSESLKISFPKNIVTQVSTNETFESMDILNDILEGKGFVHLDGLTIKRSILGTEIRFDTHFRQAQDADFLYQLLLKRNIKSVNSTEVVAIRYIHSANRIHDIENAHYYTSLLCEKWLLNSDFTSRLNRSAIQKLFFRKHHHSDHGRTMRSLNSIKDYLLLPDIRKSISLKDLLYLIKSDFR